MISCRLRPRTPKRVERTAILTLTSNCTPTPASAPHSLWLPMALHFPPASVWQFEAWDESDDASFGPGFAVLVNQQYHPVQAL